MSRRRQKVVVPVRSVRVPTPTWVAAKQKAAAEGITLTEVIQKALFDYASS